jgi:hypothetical protein
MSLPWVRLDSNFYTHDKVLWLTTQRDGYRAIAVYVFSMGYAGGHGTDGYIPRHVLPIIQGTERIAQLLVEARLWEYAEQGWQIRNWGQRQELAIVAEAKRAGAAAAGRKSQCVQRHGPDCGCWRAAEVVDIPNDRSSGRSNGRSTDRSTTGSRGRLTRTDGRTYEEGGHLA